MAGRDTWNDSGRQVSAQKVTLRYTREGLPVVDVVSLLGCHREARLLYGDTEYRLQLTATDKLILTK